MSDTVSPDFWHNLALFGASLSTAANQRTNGGFLANGPGFGGALGAGTLNFNNLQRQQALTDAQLAQTAAQTQGLNFNNQINAMSMPLIKAGTQQALHMMQPQDATPESSGSVPSTYATNIAQSESGGDPNARNPRSSATGPDQFIDSTWQQFAQENPQYFQGMTPQQIMDARINPTISAAATDWLASKNAPVLQQAGFDASPGNLALAHRMGAANATRVLQAPPTASVYDALAMGGPDAAKAVIAANPDLQNMTTGALIQKMNGVASGGTQYAGPGVPQPPAQAPNAIQPDPGLLARAQQYQNMARAFSLNPHTAGMAAQYQAQAQTYLKMAYAGPQAAAEAAGKLPYQRYEVRPGGGLMDPNGNVMGSMPILSHEIDPNGAQYQVFRNPVTGQAVGGGVGGGPNGTSGAMQTSLSPGKEGLITNLAKQYVDEGKKAYNSANQTLGWAENMEHSFDTLNSGGGWSATGTANQTRLEIAKGINSFFQTVGAKPPIDPMKIASWEEANKITKTAGMQLVNSMFGGSREAASIINSATSAVPNTENTPIGGKLVLHSIVEASRNVMDRHVFETNWMQAHDGNLIGAQEAFNKQYPPAMYTRRAISTVQPYAIKTPEDAKRFLPGTYVKTPDGRVLVVPGDPSIELTGQPAQ